MVPLDLPALRAHSRCVGFIAPCHPEFDGAGPGRPGLPSWVVMGVGQLWRGPLGSSGVVNTFSSLRPY